MTGPTTPRDDGGQGDSAGVAWAGRELPAQPFAGDTGEADPVVAEVLARFAEGGAGAAEMVAALASARLLVPVVAVLGEDHPLPTHLRGDLGAEMAMVTLDGTDGGRALPVFTSTEALARWDRAARPVPVDAVRAAHVALSEGCDRWVVDTCGPVPVVVPRPALSCVARDVVWVPPADDAELLDLLRAALTPLPQVRGVRAQALGVGGLRIVLGVTAGMDRDELEPVVAAASRALAEVAALATRTDRVELKILPA